MFNSSWPHGLQYSRLLFPPLSPRICQNSYPLNWWWHSTTSSSVIFSLFLESFPVSGSFPMSWLFTLGSCSHQYLSFSISPSNEYWGLISFRIDWFDLLAVWGTQIILPCFAFFMVQVSHLYMTTGKTIALTIWTFVSKVMSLLF